MRTPSDRAATRPATEALRALSRHRGARAGIALLALVAALAVIGPTLTPWQPDDQDFDNLAVPPGVGGHILGTDLAGVDVLANLASATGTSLLVALTVGIATPALAGAYGILTSVRGGRVDTISGWILDTLLLLPTFLAAAIAAGAGATMGTQQGSLLLLTIVLASTSWLAPARTIRALTSTLVRRDYVTAVRYAGGSTWRIARRHIAPHLVGPLSLQVVVSTLAAVAAETSLSFLGVGVQAPHTSLGRLLADAMMIAFAYPWVAVAPVAVLIVLTLSLGLLADAARDVADPTGTALSRWSHGGRHRGARRPLGQRHHRRTARRPVVSGQVPAQRKAQQD